MEPIHLFDLAAKQAHWLSTSQSVIANNVANANTPGFEAKTVRPFEDVLAHTQLTLASTEKGHLTPTQADEQAGVVDTESPWEVSESGNSVSLEQEMIKANDVSRQYALNTNLVKSFHSLLMLSVKE